MTIMSNSPRKGFSNKDASIYYVSPRVQKILHTKSLTNEEGGEGGQKS